MIGRRGFIAGAATAVAAPFVLRQARAQGPRIRRNVQTLANNDPVFAKYGQAIQAMHQLPANNPRSWRSQALIHITHCPHTAQDFVHWHRHYILNYELICGQLIGDPTFALPYWDWSTNRGRIPDPFYDLNQLNVQFWNDPSNAQSDNWGPDPVTTVGTRALAKGRGLQDDPRFGNAFTPAAIDAIKRLSDFDLFTGRLEGSPHNNGHVVTGGATGHMGDGMSPLDPIFWLHHCNIDRIWAEWQVGNTTPPLNLNYNNQFVNGAGQPVMASSASALDYAAMGYTYDILSAPVVAQLGQDVAAAAPVVAQLQDVNVAAQVLGADTSQKTAAAAVQTKFTVETKELPPSVLKPRTYWSSDLPGVKRLANERGRVLARLKNVTAPTKKTPLVVNVYVNCPYLSPETPSYDPHYADSFSFFGRFGKSHAHGDYVIDVSRALAGRPLPTKLDVQLMPLPVDSGSDASFTVGGVEIVRV